LPPPVGKHCTAHGGKTLGVRPVLARHYRPTHRPPLFCWRARTRAKKNRSAGTALDVERLSWVHVNQVKPVGRRASRYTMGTPETLDCFGIMAMDAEW